MNMEGLFTAGLGSILSPIARFGKSWLKLLSNNWLNLRYLSLNSGSMELNQNPGWLWLLLVLLSLFCMLSAPRVLVNVIDLPQGRTVDRQKEAVACLDHLYCGVSGVLLKRWCISLLAPLLLLLHTPCSVHLLCQAPDPKTNQTLTGSPLRYDRLIILRS